MTIDMDEIRVSRKKMEEIIPIFEYLKATNKRRAAPYPTLGLEAKHNQLFQVLVHSEHIENIPGTDSFYLVSNPLDKPRLIAEDNSQFTDFREFIQSIAGDNIGSNFPRIIIFIVIVMFVAIFVLGII